MGVNEDTLQLQYEGYRDTPPLWKSSELLGLSQFSIPFTPSNALNRAIERRLRLGKLVEQFVFFELEQLDNLKVLVENEQIKNEKITIGEIDALFLFNDSPIHLEIVYKFYLYDPSIGNTEIEKWIGPNRNDSLLKKLTKLKDKQLPLLYKPQTDVLLKDFNIDKSEIQQKVLFKAQLFIPYGATMNTTFLNNNCIVGFYIQFFEIEQFSNCKFIIPKKTDWLIKPYAHVNWLDFTDFKSRVSEFIKVESSPLCWIKFPNGTLQKFFVVWWN
ncbi:DUF1853 family protein [Urechidicola vernalis]|uniref:DUF1853 family protein n=1 Tax=Urechidicola vernalis TaxID=3075600 RepID=A0ABU2Y1T4_9FLAO|nr:DUF1853 family protein [Urechidicola sp. P050]MDT0551982.1 DUF1853 family protein [Urechidicola sp. P050]